MKILCRYQYDPLDRLTGLRPAEHVGTQRFYQTDDLVNEIEGQIQLTILRHEAQPLAQRLNIANVAETTLLATDQQRSVLQTLTATDTRRLVYTAYGHQPAESGLSSLLGFNGERPDPITGHYLLGQGNRAFNPVLMRFNSPDEFSPFGDGGINPYAYCGGDPVNRYDPSGNIPSPINALTLRKSVIVRKPAIVRKSVIAGPSVKKTAGGQEKLFRPWEENPQQGSFTSSSPTRRPTAEIPTPAPEESRPVRILSPEGKPRRRKALMGPVKWNTANTRELQGTARRYDEYAKLKRIQMNPDPYYINEFDLADKAPKGTAAALRRRHAKWKFKKDVMTKIDSSEEANMIRDS